MKTVHSQLAHSTNHHNPCKIISPLHEKIFICTVKLKFLPCFQNYARSKAASTQRSDHVCNKELHCRYFDTVSLRRGLWLSCVWLHSFYPALSSAAMMLWVHCVSVALLGKICFLLFLLKRIRHPTDKTCHLVSFRLGPWLNYGDLIKLFLVKYWACNIIGKCMPGRATSLIYI